MAQRGQRVRRLSALRDEQGKPAFRQDRLAITKLAREIDVDRDAGKLLEPVFADHARIIGCTAGNDGDALDRADVEIHLRQCHALFDRAQVGAQRLRDHGRLFENLLLHEVVEIALLDRRRGRARGLHRPLYNHARGIVDDRLVAGDRDPVALFEIGNLLGQRGECQCVRAEEGLALAIAHDQRRAEPRADQHVGMVAEGDGQRKGTAQARQHLLHCILWRQARLDLPAEQMDHGLGIGFAFEDPAIGDKFVAQLLEILDNPVVDKRDMRGRMWVGIALGRGPMRGPARMRDTGDTSSGVARQFLDQVFQLALSPATQQLAFVDGTQARAVIAAILHAPEAVEQPRHNVTLTDNPDNSAH